MTTFSQLVDSLVLEHARQDLRSTIESYVNLVLRELHTAKPAGGAVLFGANLREATLTADIDQGFSWDIPSPAIFQRLEVVRYDLYGTGKDSFAREKLPSGMQLETRYDKFYYRAGQRFSFANYGGAGQTISIAWYEVPPRLRWYPPTANTRPCTWNIDTQDYDYAPAYAGTENLRAEARAKCTNWILERWEDLVAQGTRPKIFARLGDVDRSKLAYSLFESLRPDMVSAETYQMAMIRNE